LVIVVSQKLFVSHGLPGKHDLTHRRSCGIIEGIECRNNYGYPHCGYPQLDPAPMPAKGRRQASPGAKMPRWHHPISPSKNPSLMRQLILELLPEAAPSLDNFVAGGNGEAMTGLAAWLLPENREHLLLLWGESGAGKTHLLRASEARYLDASSDPGLTGIGEALDFYAIDKVEALNETGQIALFNLFNRLRAAGGRLLVAATVPPLQLKLREDLRTRLGSGLVYRLLPLTDTEKTDAIRAQAIARGLRLPPDALNYLFARAPRDMRSLTAFMTALDRYSLEHKRPITLPLLREVLNEAPQTPLDI
jgi:DnaA family protein